MQNSLGRSEFMHLESMQSMYLIHNAVDSGHVLNAMEQKNIQKYTQEFMS